MVLFTQPVGYCPTCLLAMNYFSPSGPLGTGVAMQVGPPADSIVLREADKVITKRQDSLMGRRSYQRKRSTAKSIDRERRYSSAREGEKCAEARRRATEPAAWKPPPLLDVNSVDFVGYEIVQQLRDLGHDSVTLDLLLSFSRRMMDADDGRGGSTVYLHSAHTKNQLDKLRNDTAHHFVKAWRQAGLDKRSGVLRRRRMRALVDPSYSPIDLPPEVVPAGYQTWREIAGAFERNAWECIGVLTDGRLLYEGTTWMSEAGEPFEHEYIDANGDEFPPLTGVELTELYLRAVERGEDKVYVEPRSRSTIR